MSESTLELQLYFKEPSTCNQAYSIIKRKQADADSDFSGIESLKKGENDIVVTAIVSPVLSDVESTIEESEADAIAVSICHDYGGGKTYGYINKVKTTRAKAINWIANQDPDRQVEFSFFNNDIATFKELAYQRLNTKGLSEYLQIAICNESCPMVEALLEMGADPSIELPDPRKKSGRIVTPIELAFNSGAKSSKIVMALLDYVDDVSFRTQTGETAIHLTLRLLQFRNDEVIQKLLELGVDPTIKDDKDNTAMVYYIQDVYHNHKMVKVMQTFLKAGYSVEKILGFPNYFALIDECIERVAERLHKEKIKSMEGQKSCVQALDRLVKLKDLIYNQ